MNKKLLTRQRQCKAYCASAVVYDWGQHCVGSVWSAEHYSVLHRVLFHHEVSHHGTSVKEQNVRVTYQGGSCSVPYPVDNSDSPPVVEQSQQGISFSCISFIIPHLWLCGVSYALCLFPSLLQCEVGDYPVTGLILRNSACPQVLSLIELCLSDLLGFCSPFYLGYFALHFWDSLSGLCALWDSLSSFSSLQLGRCTLGLPVWPVIGFPLLGVHPSISLVKLIVIGYHCNCLDGQLNYQAFTHWLINVTIMYQLCYQ